MEKNIYQLVFVAGEGDGKTTACVMSAVSILAGEKFSDTPVCACPVVRAFAIKLNDSLNDADRQKLKVVAPKILGTKGSSALKLRRAFKCADQAVRVFAPIALRGVGLNEEADKLAALPVIDSEQSARSANSAAAAASAAASAYSAGSAAASAAARSAAAYSAGSAAYSAAVDAQIAFLVELCEMTEGGM